MTRPAAPSVVRSATAGRPAPGCSAWKPGQLGRLRRQQRDPACGGRSPTTRDRCLRHCSPARSATPANNVLFYVKGGAAVTDNRYRRPRSHRRPARPTAHDRHPLGWHGRRRPRIWLRPELVGRHRIRSPVHAGQDLQLRQQRRLLASAGTLQPEQHPPGRRYRHRPRQLPLRRPGRREVLISAPPEFQDREKAGLAPAFFCAVSCCRTC